MHPTFSDLGVKMTKALSAVHFHPGLWNDQSGTTHKMVLDVIMQAVEKAATKVPQSV